MSSRRRRCPQHLDGCVKHPNPHPPARVPGNPAKRRTTQPPRRGSLTNLVAVYHTTGSGNPARRRRLLRKGNR